MKFSDEKKNSIKQYLLEKITKCGNKRLPGNIFARQFIKI